MVYGILGIFKTQHLTAEGISPSSNMIHNTMGVSLSDIKGGDREEGPLISEHLGTPWSYWQEGSRYLGYKVHDGDRTI